MAGDMAANIYHAREPCNMGRKGFDCTGKRRYGPAEPLWPNAGSVHLVQHRLFHPGIQRVRVPLPGRAHKRTFGKLRRAVRRAAKTYSDHNRRAGI